MSPRFLAACGIALLLVALSLSLVTAQGPAPKVSPELAAELAVGPADFLVVFSRQADLSAASRLPDRAAKATWVVRQLQRTAAAEQAPLRALLERRGVPTRPFWIVNVLLVRGDADLARLLSARTDVARLVANQPGRTLLPRPQPLSGSLVEPLAVDSVEWNVARVGASEVWETYDVRGEGVVVANNDTGVRWDHEALREQYRGWDAETETASHDYAWHDAFGQHLAPYDDHGHGTHTTGTAVGDNERAAARDGALRRQIGMAPGARWIACRNMNAGVGSPASYLDCFEWLLAPTRSDGSDPQPALSPDIINNSWACTSGEGCTNDQLAILASAADSIRAAGILSVAAAGNQGNSSCGTVSDPPTIYPEVFSVGATNSANSLASFSSIGPVIRDGSQRFKPDLVAPGQNVVSSTSWSTSAYATSSGTSMATPAVSGVAALMLSAAPHLSGKVSLIEQILHKTAQSLTASVTIGHPTNACLADGSLHPNLLYGWGLVRARAAVEVAQSCPRADFDGSGAVDVLDLALQAAVWHQPVDTLTQGFDLNRDGTIDIVDLTRASAEWLAVCQFASE